jgi:NAD(P)-dependent dehydrogenase (short-subunit alcohol dehydrogenase family)
MNAAVVLVTGGTGALGSAVARAFLDDGAEVLVTYRSPAKYEVLQDAASKARGLLSGYQVDVTDEAAVARTVADIEKKCGRLDSLVNTVGAYAGGAKLWEGESATLEHMLSANLRSAFIVTRGVLPVLLRQGHGSIVSIAARAAVDQPGGSGAYVAAKAGLVAMMHSLAMDLRGTGVRANTVLPNVIDTAANRRDMPKADFGKWTPPEQIAAVIRFLCGPDSRAISGAAIPV